MSTKTQFSVNMPPLEQKDSTALMSGVPQLAAALTVAETNNWVSAETATRLFAFICSQLGYEVDAEEELKRAKEKPPEGTEDYVNR